MLSVKHSYYAPPALNSRDGLFTATLNSTLIWTFCRLYDTHRAQLKFVSLQASLCKTRFMRSLSSPPFISNFSVCAAAGRIMTRERGRGWGWGGGEERERGEREARTLFLLFVKAPFLRGTRCAIVRWLAR